MVIVMKSITLQLAENIADAAIVTAMKSNFAPVTVVILDSWGHTVVSKRMDGCAPVGIPQFAHAKANTCIIMRTSTSAEFRDRYVVGADQAKICQLNSMVDLAGNVGGMAPFPGGVLLVSKVINPLTGKEEQSILGAIGVSGAKGLEDEMCAMAGLQCLNRHIKE